MPMINAPMEKLPQANEWQQMKNREKEKNMKSSENGCIYSLVCSIHTALCNEPETLEL